MPRRASGGEVQVGSREVRVRVHDCTDYVDHSVCAAQVRVDDFRYPSIKVKVSIWGQSELKTV